MPRNSFRRASNTSTTTVSNRRQNNSNTTEDNYNFTSDEMTSTTTKTQPTFSFGSSNTNFGSGGGTTGRGRKGGNSNRHRRTTSEDTDHTDGAASLTYSATSSVQSGGSAAGESTDSSFADIMRVLDLQDSDQLKEFIKKEGCTSMDELQKKRGWAPGGGMSVASSLAYSTDAESHLEGTKLLQTIAGFAGQPSDSYAFDGGGLGDDKMDLMFAPAAPAVVKRTKGNKAVLGKEKKEKHNSRNNTENTNNRNSYKSPTSGSSSNRKTYPFDENSNVRMSTPEQQRYRHHYNSSPSPSTSSKSTPTKSPPEYSSTSSGGLPGTPPLPTRKHFTRYRDGTIIDDDEDIWYKEWWMSCFPDAFKNLMPKR